MREDFELYFCMSCRFSLKMVSHQMSLQSFEQSPYPEENYQRCSNGQLGKGAYGTVYKGRDTKNPGSYVAIKEIKIPLQEEGIPMNALREIGLLKQLDKFNHPNIVRWVDFVG